MKKKKPVLALTSRSDIEMLALVAQKGDRRVEVLKQSFVGRDRAAAMLSVTLRKRADTTTPTRPSGAYLYIVHRYISCIVPCSVAAGKVVR